MSILTLLEDERTSQQVKRIYDAHKFPFDIRYHLREMLEEISWEGIKNLSTVDHHAAVLFQDVIKAIQGKIADDDLNPLDKMKMRESLTTITQQYSHQPVHFVDVMRDCFKQESCIQQTRQRNPDREVTDVGEDLFPYIKMEEEVVSKEQKLKEINPMLEALMDRFRTSMDEMVPKISDINESMRQTQQSQDESLDHVEKQNIENNMQKFLVELKKIVNEITSQKNKLWEYLGHGYKLVFEALQLCWKAIDTYKQQQKDAVCYLGGPPDGAVNSLNSVCEIGGQYLMGYLSYIERVLLDIGRVPFRDDCIKANCEKIQANLNQMLEQHMMRVLVITRQPQNVIKIVSSKSPPLHMSVTLLGATSLGVTHTLPKVTTRVYDEKNLEKAIEEGTPKMPGVCKTVENGSNVQMIIKRPKNLIQANMNSIVLRGVHRLEKKDKDDRVTEYKYGFLCYTEVTVRGVLYALKVLSQPVVLTSQTSQEGAAKGILVWDAAFSDFQREIYMDPPQVPWERLRDVLDGMFKETGRGLDHAQLDYIKRYICGNGIASAQQDEAIITRERFLRGKVRGCDFTYWMWIYACKNLIRDYVNAEWKDRLIYGFIGRMDAERLLDGKPVGTFLLRFRERRLQDTQKASKCAFLAVAVVIEDPKTMLRKIDHVKDHLTPVDIHKQGLSKILKSMVGKSQEPLLQILYPDQVFVEVIRNHLLEDGNSSEGYTPTEFFIRVGNGHSDPDGSEDPCLSPISIINPQTPATPGESVLPPVDDDDLPNLDDLLQFIDHTPIPTTVMDIEDNPGSGHTSPIRPPRRSSRSKTKGENNQ